MTPEKQFIVVYLSGMLIWAMGTCAYYGFTGAEYDEGSMLGILLWPFCAFICLIALPFVLAFKVGEFFRK